MQVNVESFKMLNSLYWNDNLDNDTYYVEEELGKKDKHLFYDCNALRTIVKNTSASFRGKNLSGVFEL